MPKRTSKSSANNPLINALTYKRLIKAGVIPQTKDNKKIPPLNNAHKAYLSRILKDPTLSAFCASPAEWAVHLLKDPAKVRAAAVPMGLDRYVKGRAFFSRVPRWRRSYFNESKMTLTICDDRTGTKTVVPFADWDALGVAGAIPDIHFTPERIAYREGKKTRIPDRDDETGEVLHWSSEVAVFDPNTFRTKAGLYDHAQFVREGFNYKLATLNAQGAGRTGICFIQRNDNAADWGKADEARASALRSRLSKTSDIRKR